MTDGARKPPFQEPVFGGIIAGENKRTGEQENRDNTFTLKTSLFGQRNVILESDLTLLNVNRDIQKIHK
ncbi:MAG: hypothetical protein ACTTHE_04020 [Prevotella multiformis]|uniref:hypothetical protein n=1 Tax=Prevotella multiformis TaxID=282402 RepID=UPI003F9EFB9A